MFLISLLHLSHQKINTESLGSPTFSQALHWPQPKLSAKDLVDLFHIHSAPIMLLTHSCFEVAIDLIACVSVSPFKNVSGKTWRRFHTEAFDIYVKKQNCIPYCYFYVHCMNLDRDDKSSLQRCLSLHLSASPAAPSPLVGKAQNNYFGEAELKEISLWARSFSSPPPSFFSRLHSSGPGLQ